MSRTSPIRWRESDIKKLERSIRNFNAKITRAAQTIPKEFLPERISKTQLKSGISTRADFNRQINKIQRFSKPGSTQLIESKTGNIVTKWERQEVAREVGILNRKRTLQRKEILQDEKSFTMRSIKDVNLMPKPFDFDKIRAGKEWEKYVESVERQIQTGYQQSTLDQYAANYIKAIENNLGAYAEPIIEILNKLSPQQIMDKFYESPTAQIDFVYDPLQSEIIANQLISEWGKAAGMSDEEIEEFLQNEIDEIEMENE